MTCIVGLKDKGVVYIGADSFAGHDWVKQKIVNPKVFKNKEFIIGYTDSFRFGQILQYEVDYPDLPFDFGIKFLLDKFVEPLRRTLKEQGYSKVDNNVEEGGGALIGIKNRLFYLQSDFAITEFYDNLFSIGKGSYSALGALNTLNFMSKNETLKPEIQVYLSLASAAKSVPSVCMPYVVMSTDGLNETFNYDPD